MEPPVLWLPAWPVWPTVRSWKTAGTEACGRCLGSWRGVCGVRCGLGGPQARRLAVGVWAPGEGCVVCGAVLEDRRHGGCSGGVVISGVRSVAYGAVLELRLCMNTLGPHFAIPASGTVEVLPFSPPPPVSAGRLAE